ncbi:hypothetical protein [Halomicrobium salinisoli]|uniref:DUF7837 family putative zinc-binding protein n=1 Tax=Halomicrobium salinisoli TaxID=2878391 RepID=UPI001CEFB6B6|nr:hypothetical protein [Halomicrobium salinisoli]
MNPDEATLGVCPDCGSEIRPVHAIIEYEKPDGQTGVYAECPECTDVVESESE